MIPQDVGVFEGAESSAQALIKSPGLLDSAALNNDGLPVLGFFTAYRLRFSHTAGAYLVKSHTIFLVFQHPGQPMPQFKVLFGAQMTFKQAKLCPIAKPAERFMHFGAPFIVGNIVGYYVKFYIRF
jgi:hypothetical protein